MTDYSNVIEINCFYLETGNKLHGFCYHLLESFFKSSAVFQMGQESRVFFLFSRVIFKLLWSGGML